MATLKELRDERLRKLEELKKLGVNPYPADSKRTHKLSEITDDFNKLKDKSVSVVGRIVNIRKIGKIAFIVIRDSSGQLQLFLRANGIEYGDPKKSELDFTKINLLDSGDFIEVNGKVIKTQTNEISVDAEKLRILSKSLRPMPTAHDGFSNKEERLRRRYIDTNVNKDVYERFIRRSKFWQAHRDYLNARGFVEINLPVLEHVTGGADANPFVTHMDALDQDFYLRISHELYIKRLIGGGYERVYDIGPRFRNENYSDEHLPEHVAMEFNAAYMGYEEGMELAEGLMKHAAKEAFGKLKFKVGKFEIDLDKKWPRIDYAKIMKDKMDVDVFKPDSKQLKEILKKNNAFLEEGMTVQRMLDGVWKLVRANEAGPFWLINEPLEISPLAKQNPKDPRVTLRVHPVIAGTEAGNGYSELNDPVDQLDRFKEQQALRDAGDKEAQMLDIDFVEMMEYGMPPNFGWGHSERFFWMLEGVSAREGVPFPQLRHEIDEVTKTIYPELYQKTGHKKGGAHRKQDFGRRIVTVVNKDLDAWQIANAIAHMDAIIGNELPKEQLTSGDYFVGSDDVAIPRNSQYPIIVMKGNEKELHKLYDKIIDMNLTHHVFIKEMQDTTNDKEIEDILEKQAIKDTIFYGVSFIASNTNAEELTKNFQLYK